MATAKLKSNVGKAMASVQQALAKRLLAAALLLQSEHQRRLSVSNPRPHRTPAAKGQYPRTRTGALRKGVVVEPTSLADVMATMEVRVGLTGNVFYGNVLEEKGWLGLKQTVADLKPKLEALIAGEVTS